MEREGEGRKERERVPQSVRESKLCYDPLPTVSGHDIILIESERLHE